MTLVNSHEINVVSCKNWYFVDLDTAKIRSNLASINRDPSIPGRTSLWAWCFDSSWIASWKTWIVSLKIYEHPMTGERCQTIVFTRNQPKKRKQPEIPVSQFFFVIVFIMDRVMYSWELTATAILPFFLHFWRLFWGFHSRYFRCFFHWTRQVGSCSVVTWPNPKVQIHDIFAASSQMAKNRCRARVEFFGGFFFCGWIFLGYIRTLYWKLWKKGIK